MTTIHDPSPMDRAINYLRLYVTRGTVPGEQLRPVIDDLTAYRAAVSTAPPGETSCPRTA